MATSFNINYPHHPLYRDRQCTARGPIIHRGLRFYWMISKLTDLQPVIVDNAKPREFSLRWKQLSGSCPETLRPTRSIGWDPAIRQTWFCFTRVAQVRCLQLEGARLGSRSCARTEHARLVTGCSRRPASRPAGNKSAVVVMMQGSYRACRTLQALPGSRNLVFDLGITYQ